MSGQSGGGGGGDPFGGGGGGRGGDYIRDRFPETYEEYIAGKQGGGGPSSYVSFDNEMGEVTLRLPPKWQKHATDLLEDLYDQFYGTPAGDPKVQEDMNLFVADWIKTKEAEEGL